MTFSRRAGMGGALALVAIASLASLALAAEADVSLVEKAFDPKDITINVGDTVTWTVTKPTAEPHSVTSGQPGAADAGQLFDSGITLRDNGQTFQFTFDQPGTYAYFCQVHPVEMTGSVTVTGAAASGGPGGSPAAGSPAPSGPAGSGAPSPSGLDESPRPGESGAPEPPGAERDPVPTASKLTAAGVLVVALAVLFVAAMFYRRFNRV